PGQPLRFQCGPFRAVLAPAPWVSLIGEVPRELWVGLLTKAPDLDGNNWAELWDGSYERLPVTLTGSGLVYLVNANDIRFGFAAVGVSHAALFTEAGRLAFYGALLGDREVRWPPSEFLFRGGSLKAKRVRT